MLAEPFIGGPVILNPAAHFPFSAGSYHMRLLRDGNSGAEFFRLRLVGYTLSRGIVAYEADDEE